MAITLTERAAAQVRRILEKRGHGLGLKLGVTPSGCTGFAYKLDVADTAGPQDLVFESHGVKVLVAQDDLPMLEGTVIDYRREGLNESFKFDNPNVKATCGCGESFAV
ncbi:iron-sulfur cluster assembly accessory protein [Tepidiphilus sp. J10]|uniref:HesB/IscA family protein n=1 Tax=Tepidiphilus sp. J10 TaxID=2502185 RepID=UPI00115D16EF|nr:iron-sulfur cluster assembly accessory protein [Tepidiphilus sp. J10]